MVSSKQRLRRHMLGTDKYVMLITFIVDKEHASGLPCSQVG